MKKSAFTLGEIIIVLMIVGVLAAVVLSTINLDGVTTKTNYSKANKVLSLFSQAMNNIVADKTNCPMGAFFSKVAGDYEKGLVVSSSGAANSTQALNTIFSKHIKFAQTGIKFCDNTPYCSSSSIPGAKLAGDIYVGLEVYSDISTCPNYYLPGDEKVITPAKDIDNNSPVCWAKLYMDVNGPEQPNTLGKDVFTIGLGQRDVAY